MSQYFIGIDLGGTGSRMGIWRQSAGTVAREPAALVFQLRGPGTQISSSGTNTAELASSLIAQGREWIAGDGGAHASLRGVGVGATGLASLAQDHLAVADQLARVSGCENVAIAADMVTAHLGALGGLAGAVVAVGTGSIALGTDFHKIWRRVDGYGHLIGDRGSGAWIGMEGLRAAAEYADGIECIVGAEPQNTQDPAQGTENHLKGRKANGSGGGREIFDAATARFGPISQWPSALYTVQNRAGVLASFAADIINLAPTNPVARRITTQAATHIAATLQAALSPQLPAQVSAVGGIMDSPIGQQVQQIVTAVDAGITWIPPQGSPLEGAGILAQWVATPQQPKAAPPPGDDAASARPSEQPLANRPLANKKALGTVAPFMWVRGSHPAQPQ